MHLPRPFEELLNALTHGVGAAAALAGGSVLITLAMLYGDFWQVLSAWVFVLCLVLLYLASTLYHALHHTRAGGHLEVFDHCAIFLLIAGTYTPFALIGLRGWWGWLLLSVIWSLAVLGVIFKLFFTGRFRRASTMIYLTMGWLGMVAIGPMVEALPGLTLGLLIGGGIAYTVGTVFYLNRRIPYSHPIWHLFVMAGSGLHFAAVTTQVLAGSSMP